MSIIAVRDGEDGTMSDATLDNPDRRGWSAPIITSDCPSCGRRATRSASSWADKTDGSVRVRLACWPLGSMLDQLECYRSWGEAIPAPTPDGGHMPQEATGGTQTAREGLGGYLDADAPAEPTAAQEGPHSLSEHLAMQAEALRRSGVSAADALAALREAL